MENFTDTIASAISEARELDAEKDRRKAAEEKIYNDGVRACEEFINHTVLQIITKAAEDLTARGMEAEIGNGKSGNGNLRRSLRFKPPGKQDATLAFIATSHENRPYVGVKSSWESEHSVCNGLGERTAENVRARVAAFIREVIIGK